MLKSKNEKLEKTKNEELAIYRDHCTKHESYKEKDYKERNSFDISWLDSTIATQTLLWKSLQWLQLLELFSSCGVRKNMRYMSIYRGETLDIHKSSPLITWKILNSLSNPKANQLSSYPPFFLIILKLLFSTCPSYLNSWINHAALIYFSH